MNQKPLYCVVQALESEYVPLEMDGAGCKHVVTGFGKVNAAVNLMVALQNERPDFVINIGTAGSFLHRVGDIVVCDRFVDRDLIKLKALDAVYALDDTDHRAFFQSLFSFNRYGVCSTGDQFVTEPQGEEDVFDMEAFAYSRVCRLLNIPFISVKYVTDRIGENSVKVWADKLADARSELSLFFASAIKKEYSLLDVR
ncbi:MAG: phosphorylase family protein [Breznakibacter sp.]